MGRNGRRQGTGGLSAVILNVRLYLKLLRFRHQSSEKFISFFQRMYLFLIPIVYSSSLMPDGKEMEQESRVPLLEMVLVFLSLCTKTVNDC